MAYFKIEYGCGCGTNEDYIEAVDLESAEETAYEYAVEDYESYAGYHGIPSWKDVAMDMFGEDVDLDSLTPEEKEDVEITYNQEREMWIDYYAEEVSEHEYYYGVDEDYEEDEE